MPRTNYNNLSIIKSGGRNSDGSNVVSTGTLIDSGVGSGSVAGSGTSNCSDGSNNSSGSSSSSFGNSIDIDFESEIRSIRALFMQCSSPVGSLVGSTVKADQREW